MAYKQELWDEAKRKCHIGDEEICMAKETEFEIWTVKNGGVNGDADTEKQKGTFSDLKPDADINMTGSYDGDDFYAVHVIIYNFV